MAEHNTLVRSLHDVGLAAWFGGSLMGAVGLNGAAGKAGDPVERLSLASEGWARWTPVNALACVVHVVGGLGLIGGNRDRLLTQRGAMAPTVAKAALTGVALTLTAYSGVLGARVQRFSDEGGRGATEPHDTASDELATAQRQLRLVQWAVPAVTASLVVLGAYQGEQQRPGQQLSRTVAAAVARRGGGASWR